MRPDSWSFVSLQIRRAVRSLTTLSPDRRMNRFYEIYFSVVDKTAREMMSEPLLDFTRGRTIHLTQMTTHRGRVSFDISNVNVSGTILRNAQQFTDCI